MTHDHDHPGCPKNLHYFIHWNLISLLHPNRTFLLLKSNLWGRILQTNNFLSFLLSVNFVLWCYLFVLFTLYFLFYIHFWDTLWSWCSGDIQISCYSRWTKPVIPISFSGPLKIFSTNIKERETNYKFYSQCLGKWPQVIPMSLLAPIVLNLKNFTSYAPARLLLQTLFLSNVSKPTVLNITGKF